MTSYIKFSILNVHCAHCNLNLFNTRYESAFLSGQQGIEFTTARFWIGLSDLETPGFYKWIDNSPVTYTNWGVGQPGNFMITYLCVTGIVSLQQLQSGSHKLDTIFKSHISYKWENIIYLKIYKVWYIGRMWWVLSKLILK